MKKDKNRGGEGQEKNPSEKVSNKEHHNPFKEAEPKQTEEETLQEEAEAEQQRKETLTERD
jgi:hypothetical protein